MARVKLTLPDVCHFQTEVTVRIGDINYGGHLGNDAVLSLAHEARLQYFKSLGYSEIDIEGVGIVLADGANAMKVAVDVQKKLVQYIKLVNQMTGMGAEWVREPRLPLVGEERARIEGIILRALETRPSLA